MGRQVDLMPVRVHTYIHLTNDALTRTRRQVQPARPSIRPGAPVPPRMPALGLDTEVAMKGAVVDVKRCKVQTCQCHIRLILHLCTSCVAWHTHNRYTTHTTETQYKHNNTHQHHIIIPPPSIMHPVSIIAFVSKPFNPQQTTSTFISYGRAWACARFTHTTPLIRPPPRRTPRGRRAPGWSGSLPVLFFCAAAAPQPLPQRWLKQMAAVAG